ncbi:hypothetical protein PVAP13_5NG272240 [Panicum virgatum]|uniref:Uncharacterized protein n=1 Tax=Panicum virgatum TaxID=38727 RepID=A0A8T0S0M7_PANVG|nr:hypothetical protein PVAP13_5NG272240 [Panicum virgatum]
MDFYFAPSPTSRRPIPPPPPDLCSARPLRLRPHRRCRPRRGRQAHPLRVARARPPRRPRPAQAGLGHPHVPAGSSSTPASWRLGGGGSVPAYPGRSSPGGAGRTCAWRCWARSTSSTWWGGRCSPGSGCCAAPCRRRWQPRRPR